MSLGVGSASILIWCSFRNRVSRLDLTGDLFDPDQEDSVGHEDLEQVVPGVANGRWSGLRDCYLSLCHNVSKANGKLWARLKVESTRSLQFTQFSQLFLGESTS